MHSTIRPLLRAVLLVSSAVLLSVAAIGCGSSSETKTDEGNVLLGTRSFHVEQEGTYAVGTSDANYAIKPNTGVAKPDLVVCWYGEMADTDRTTGNYDANDGDFDCAPPVAVSPPADAMLWISVTYAGVVSTASLDVTK